jgi:hypothetical protein
MKVLLKPVVDVQDGTWRAAIPANRAWFESYRSFIGKYAKLAQEEKVEAFSNGCEYSANQSDEAEWRRVVKLVRSRFKGPLTYACNFDSYQKVAWWDAVDFVGIDAYFPLTNKLDPTLPELVAAWKRHAEAIEAWRASRKIAAPVAFLEFGFRSMDGANREPWAWANPGKVDLQEQSDCLEATYRVMNERDWWRGGFGWN